MAILNFPNEHPGGGPLQVGDTYNGDNGVVYIYDGVKWVGRTTVTIGYTGSKGDPGSNANTANFIFTASQISVSNDSDITVVTNANTWTFGTDGVITLPSGNTRIGDFNGLDAMVGSPGTGVGVASQGPGGFIALEWIDNIENIGTTASTQVAAVVVNSPIASTSGTVQIATGLSSGPTADYIWEFGADGKLTAPGHIIPNADLTYDLGSTTTQWRSIYVGTGTIYIGGVALGVNENNYVTVDGNPIITVNTAGNFTVQGDTNIVLGAVVISDTAPPATTPGSQWYNSVDGRTYIAYNDQWLDASPVVVPSPGTYLGNIDIDGDTLNINGGTLTIDDTGTLLVNGSEVTGGGSSDYTPTTPSDWNGSPTVGTVTSGLDELASRLTVVESSPTDIITSGGYSVSVAATGVVTMATSRGNVEFGALPEPGGTSHFHIMKSSEDTSIDLFFGDDYNYVLQRGNSQSESEGHTNDYGVEIGTRDLSTGTSDQYVWRFETDGIITLPNSMTIDGSGTGGESVLIGGTSTQIIVSNDGAPPGFYVRTNFNVDPNVWLFGPDGSTTFPNDTILGTGEDPNVYIETSTTATTSTWTFGTDGVLTLPADTPIIKGGGTGTDVTVIASTGSNTSTWTFSADGWLKFPNDAVWMGYDTNQFSINSSSDLEINTNPGTGWIFGSNSTLTYPDGVIKDGNTEIIPGTDAATTTQGGNQVIWTASTSTIVSAKVIVRGQLDYANHAAMWTVNMVKAGDGFNYNVTDTIVSTSSYSTSDPTVGIDGSGRFYIEKIDNNDCAYTFSVTEFGTTY